MQNKQSAQTEREKIKNIEEEKNTLNKQHSIRADTANKTLLFISEIISPHKYGLQTKFYSDHIFSFQVPAISA